MNLVRYFARNPALAKGSEAALRRLAEASEHRVFLTGDRLVHTGSPQSHVIMLAEGTIETHRRNRTDGKQVSCGSLSAPALIGDAELYAGTGIWVVTITARTAVDAIFIPNDAFNRFVESDVQIAVSMYRDAASRLLLAIQIIQTLSLERVQDQVLHLLMRLAKQESEGGPPIARLSQVDLARALGVNPRTIARSLADLEEEGMIRRDGDTVEIAIVDPGAVAREMRDVGFGAHWSIGGDDGEEPPA
jgi:CRP-like cAMP-binding protein